jgi:hypothetical protein
VPIFDGSIGFVEHAGDVVGAAASIDTDAVADGVDDGAADNVAVPLRGSSRVLHAAAHRMTKRSATSRSTAQNPYAAGSAGCGYGFSGRAGAPLADADALGAVLVEPRDAGRPGRAACAVFFDGVLTVVIVATGAASAGAPTVVNVVGEMTGVTEVVDVGAAGGSAASDAAVAFAGCFPASNLRSCGQNFATEPIAAASTSAAMPIKKGNPLRACSGAARRSGGRLGLTLPGV